MHLYNVKDAYAYDRKPKKLGNSLGIRLPSIVARSMNLNFPVFARAHAPGAICPLQLQCLS